MCLLLFHKNTARALPATSSRVFWRGGNSPWKKKMIINTNKRGYPEFHLWRTQDVIRRVHNMRCTSITARTRTNNKRVRYHNMSSSRRVCCFWRRFFGLLSPIMGGVLFGVCFVCVCMCVSHVYNNNHYSDGRQRQRERERSE